MYVTHMRHVWLTHMSHGCCTYVTCVCDARDARSFHAGEELEKINHERVFCDDLPSLLKFQLNLI